MINIRNSTKIVTAVLVFALFLLWQQVAAACDLTLTPSSFSTQAGSDVTFRLERVPTHKTCVTPLEDTKIIVTGGDLVDPGKWQKGTPDILIFKVKFNAPGQSTVRVERECTKVGLIFVEAQGTVTTAQNATPVKDTAAPKSAGDTPTTAPVVSSNSTGSGQAVPEQPSSEQTLLEKFVSSLTLDSLHLQLWYIFFLAGLALFLFKLKRLRVPLLFLSMLILGFYTGGCPEPVGTPFILLMGSKSILKIAIILLAVPVLLSLIWGRIFCGWICPLGAVQEIIHAQKTGWRLPAFADKTLKYLKFVLLLIFGLLSWQATRNVWSEYEPFKVLFNFDGSSVAIAILVLTLLLAVFIERVFCRYICPLGAILSITSRIAPYKVTTQTGACKSCGKCTGGICPTNAISTVNHKSKQPEVDNSECIKCLRCEDECRFKAIYLKIFVAAGRKTRIAKDTNTP